ncbi:STAS domain-containing protein [Ruania halotolerans]|uniref:STAS domain-containing protein n=1 Tax=Ruania halotolerans TaxID=2897773 RepID=UPI001E61D8CE|nr:STAS domain-containing protein [Ruania halotolerans]UFU06047.1 STAS domain-containing protein [Ruania halotolerans]
MRDANSSGAEPRRAATGAGAEAGTVHTLLEASYTRLVLSGEVDMAMSDELTEAVAEAEAAGLPVQVDVRHVQFMDSSGISLLARLASRTPGRMTMIRPPDVVRFLLEVTRVGDLVDIVDDDTQGAPSAGE